MLNIQDLRSIKPSIVAIGSHPPIIQSMLDYDFLSEKNKPTIKAIIATGKKYERYFFGKNEVLIPVFNSVEKLPLHIKNSLNLFINVTSARRSMQTSIEVLENIPSIIGGTIFAEDVPEQHSISLFQYIKEKNKFIIGPASVGLILPGNFKMGAIGGTDYRQLIGSSVMTPGNIAVLSASGGMVNEIINLVKQQGKRLSFSLSFGGDRFPILTPEDAFIAAEDDPLTKSIIYYGELGGDDEYRLAELIKQKRITKNVICFIAGIVSELFDAPPQFGHAKAIAKTNEEGARAKREILKKSGCVVPVTFAEFVKTIKEIPVEPLQTENRFSTMGEIMNNRKPVLFTTSISDDTDGQASILSENLLTFVQNRSFAAIVASMFLGKKNISKDLEEFVDLVLRLCVDHGPYVSGAVNTIITARAGRDLVSSLSAGLLTIGPRFGGAVNQASINWLDGVVNNKSSFEFVEEFAIKKIYIQGIGHKKYSIDLPDPRVDELLKFADRLHIKKFTNFALKVQSITTSKKGNLILNVDGAIASILLDILSEKENYSDEELIKLTEIEFFNALFVLSRSVGFISHYLDQKRLDEGLFRLPEELVANLDLSNDL